MTQISRRALVQAAPMIPIALALQGCPSFTSAVTSAVAIAPTIAGYMATIAKVASVVEPLITGITGFSTNVSSTIATALADVQSVASGITSATTTTGAVLAQKLGSGVNTLATLLSGAKVIPAEVGSFISNAMALLPAIEAAFGITPAPAASRFAMAGISAEQADANLQLILAGHGVR
jgi:hypothetical protein